MYKRKNRSVRQYFINIMENSLFAEFEEKIKKVYIIISIFYFFIFQYPFLLFPILSIIPKSFSFLIIVATLFLLIPISSEISLYEYPGSSLITLRTFIILSFTLSVTLSFTFEKLSITNLWGHQIQS